MHERARAGRADLSRRGRGDAAAAPPSRPKRLGTLDYAPKVVASSSGGGQRVTGLHAGLGPQVTGDARGSAVPVSGTQYIAADSGAAWRAGGPKVGLARTEGGLVVSGTLLRSKVRVTGDEAAAAITGEADQRPEDDVTKRAGDGALPAAQFQRQTDPHGTSVFGSNLGRSARSFGSRERQRRPAIESTDGGLAITGSAVGRSLRVTGDEAGACRQVTGDQYLAPAAGQAECGGRFGGSAPAAQIAAGRPDPVTGAKVAVGQTWSRQRVTGIDVEHDPRVTGDAPGTCATITGSPYQGAGTVHAWCDPQAAGAVEERLGRGDPAATVTGDTPVHDAAVSGTARGAARAITGTPYYREPSPAAAAGEPVAALDERFSVRSPQRAAHVRAVGRATQAPGGGRITGSFAVGQGKVTGNLEFTFRPRQTAGQNGVAAHLRISGEGRTKGRRITGEAWTEQSNVTGTEGAIARDRNPSESAGKPQAFAGSCRFKALASDEEPKHLVTGTFGYSSDSAAKVTLSGGAQG